MQHRTQLLRLNCPHECFGKYILQYNKGMKSYSTWVVLLGLSSGSVESLSVKQGENPFTDWISLPHSPALSLAKAKLLQMESSAVVLPLFIPQWKKERCCWGKVTSYFSKEHSVTTSAAPTRCSQCGLRR